MTKLTAKNKADIALYKRALKAGAKALAKATPTPMIIGEAKNFFSNEIDDSKPTYYVEGGCCGFAWINVKSKNGGLKFINSLVKGGFAKKGDARYSAGGGTPSVRFRKDCYYGGYTFWVKEGGQSMDRKEAFARAFARVLCDSGITAYSNSRMD